MTEPARTIAGEITAVNGDVLTVQLWTDPDTGETLELDVQLTPPLTLAGTAYVSVSPDGAVLLGEPFAGGARGLWTYAGTDVSTDPGAGGVAIAGSGNQPREFAISSTDADGFPRYLAVLQAGDNVTITDDPVTPPISGFARYVLITEPVDAGGYWTFTANRTDTAGTTLPPPVGTRLRISYDAGGGGGGGGPYTVKFDTYEQLLNGIIIGG